MKKTKIARNRIITYTTTLLVKKSGLILGLAFFIFACEEPGELGLDLNPESGDFVARYQEIHLDNSVLLYEDIVSDNSTRFDSLGNITAPGRLFAGSFSNPSFGKFVAKGFNGLYLVQDTTEFSNENGEYVFDSLILRMKVDYLYGNDLFGQKSIFIHELTDSLELDKLYLTKNSTAYSNESIGEFVFDFSAFDTLRVDTLLKTRISDEIGLRFLLEAEENDTTFSNNNLFRQFFYGFAFVGGGSNEMVTGMVPESRSSYMRMHFHNSTDTLYKDFMFFDRDTIPGNTTKYYNNITLDRTGSPIEGITEYYTEFQTGNELSYIQASAGVFTKISLQPYLDFIDTIDYMVINRAEIEIPTEAYGKNTIPSSSLHMYAVDQDNRFIEEYFPTRSTPLYKTMGSISFVKNEDENSGTYINTLTDYVQLLTDGTEEELHTELLLGQINLWNSVQSVNQTVLRKEGLTLKVYYSTIQ